MIMARLSSNQVSKRIAKGFTLVELLVVMAILSILVMAVIPLSQNLIIAKKERDLKHALWEIRDAIDRHKQYVDEKKIIPESSSINGYPRTLNSLVEGAVRSDDGLGNMSQNMSKHYFLRRIPRDPFAPLDTPADTHWGLRSYESMADNPQTGADVYDIYSKISGKALDGTNYKDW
jgi:general secretion pathway protein G